MTSMRPAIVICVPHAPPLWMTREDDSSPISLDGTNVRYCGDTPRHQAGHARTQTCSNARSRKETIKESATPFTRVEAMNPARILAPGFFAQLRPDLVGTHPGRQSVAGCGPQRGEVEVGTYERPRADPKVASTAS